MAQGLTHSTPPTAYDQAQEMSATSPTWSGSLTLISNLPVELLQLIFGYCTEFEDPTIGLYRTCPSWVYVTHVCSHWRTTALNCSSLWTLINTDTMGKRWIGAFLERSKASLIDVTFNLASYSYTSTHWPESFLDLNEFIALFTGCTRLRSLHFIGELNIVYKLLDALQTATHIRSLSLNIDFGLLWIPHVNLPENLFGGQAPVCEARFITSRHIVAPRWLLRGITHFTSNQRMPLQILLETLRQMPLLYSLTLERCVLNRKGTDSDVLQDDQIPMQNLMYLTVDVGAESSVVFSLLHRRLALPNGAKKRLRTHSSSDSFNWANMNSSILAIPPFSTADHQNCQRVAAHSIFWWDPGGAFLPVDR